MSERIVSIELYRALGGAIVKNDHIDSDPIDLRNLHFGSNELKAALHVITLGGTITASVLVCSTEDGTYVEPDTNVDILTAVAAGTHVSANTALPNMPWIKIRFTETNVAAVTSMYAWLHIRG